MAFPNVSRSTAPPARSRSTASSSRERAASASSATATSRRSMRRAEATPRSGERAEAIAAQYLVAQGLVIVARNYRTRRGEIDLIARDGDTLVFVEVRMRSRADFGGAAASVTLAKRERWIAAALAY